MKRLSPNQLTKLCRKWQAKLRLQDWDVTIRWAKNSEMMEQNVDGQCHVLASNKEARILISEDQHNPVEYVVAHELGHLHLHSLSTKENIEQVEQALHGFIHALTRGNG